MSEEITKITTDIAEVYIDGGILFTRFMVMQIELAAIKQHQSEVNAVFGHLLPLPSIVEMPANSKSPDKEVRDYTASPESTSIVLSTAVIAPSAFMRTVANFYFKFAKMPTPIKLFADIPSAIEWSKQFIK